MASPNIRSEHGQVVATCPYCTKPVYKREAGPGAELSCAIAFGLHVKTCPKRPGYIESDIARLKKEFFGE
jgi:hypothetical protein